MKTTPNNSPPLGEIEPRRVCLIKPSALGDIVQTLPILGMLRSRWPTAEVHWVVNRSLSGILKDHPQLTGTIEFSRGGNAFKQATSFAGLLKRLRATEFDLTIDLQGLFRSGLMTWATGAKRRVGFGNAREGAGWTYTDRVPIPSLMMPALEKYRLVAAALGCSGVPPAAALGIWEADRSFARDRLAGLPRPILAILPGAQWETKRWPPEHFAELAKRAHSEFGAGIALVGGPGEGDLCREVAARLDSSVVDLSERTSLLQLAAVLSHVDVLLSGDTGPMHLAAAVGTRVVSVFTCTSPLRAGPRGQERSVVATNVPCAASYLKRCGDMICMRELTPDRVWPALSAALLEPSKSTAAA